MTEHDLWNRCQETGDLGALEDLYRRHRAAILRATEAILGSGADAEDAAQRAWLQAIEGARGSSKVRNFKGWIARIAGNSARDVHRRARVRRSESLPTEAEGIRTKDPASTASNHEWRSALLDALKDLPVEIREPLLLHFFADCSLAEISLMLGLPKSTVQHRYERGLKRLKRRLSRFAIAIGPALMAWFTSRSAPAQVAESTTRTGAFVTMTTKGTATACAIVVIVLGVGIGLMSSESGKDRDPATSGSVALTEKTASATDSSSASATALDETPIKTEAFAEATEGPPPAANSGYRIQGIVQIGKNPASAGLKVHAIAIKGWKDLDLNSEPPPEAETATLETSAGGRFVWDRPVPETAVTYGFRCSLEGHDPASFEGLVRRKDAPPDNIKLTLQRRDAMVNGRVLDREGNPIIGASVQVYAAKTSSDAEGRFTLGIRSSQIAPRALTSAPGYGSAITPFKTPVAGEATEILIHLQPEVVVRGRALTHLGQPLTRATIQANYDGVPRKLTPDEHGQFLVKGLSREADSIYVTATIDDSVCAVAYQEGPFTSDVELLLRCLPSCSVSGIVVDDSGLPIEGLFVEPGPMRNGMGSRALTGSDGSFRLLIRGSGQLPLRVHGLGYAHTTISLDLPENATELPGQRIVVSQGGSLKGRVVDGAGQPISGAYLVTLVRQDYLPGRFNTNSLGEFEITGLPNDPGLKLECFLLGYTRVRLPVKSGDQNVNVVLKRAAGLYGTVLDAETREPITKFRVRIVRPELQPGEEEGSNYSADLSTLGLAINNTEGQWAINNEELTEGDIFGIAIDADGYASGFDRHVPATSNPDPKSCTLLLKRACALEVSIVSEARSTPIEAAAVRALAPEHREQFYNWPDFTEASWKHSDEKGIAVFQDLSEGTFEFDVRVAGYPPQLVGPISVTGRTSRVTLRLVEGATVKGRVLDASGNPVPGCSLLLVVPENSGKRIQAPSQSASSDAEGRFEFLGVLGGTYRLTRTFSTKTSSWFTEWVEFKAPDQGVINIDLRPRGNSRVVITLDGTIESATGSLAAIQLVCVDDADSWRPMAVPRGGVATFDGIEAGTWHVNLMKPAGDGFNFGWTELGTIEVVAGRKSTATFRP